MPGSIHGPYTCKGTWNYLHMSYDGMEFQNLDLGRRGGRKVWILELVQMSWDQDLGIRDTFSSESRDLVCPFQP